MKSNSKLLLFSNFVSSYDLPINLLLFAFNLLLKFTFLTFSLTSKSLARPGIPYFFKLGETARHIVFPF